MSLFQQFSCLLDGGPKEQDIHNLLAANPIILKRFIGNLSDKTRFVPQVSFQKHVTDFALANWSKTTFRWEWTLIEIERSSYRLFTKNGDPSHQLTHALRQIADWRAWIQK
jgi:hypothetical protein